MPNFDAARAAIASGKIKVYDTLEAARAANPGKILVLGSESQHHIWETDDEEYGVRELFALLPTWEQDSWLYE